MRRSNVLRLLSALIVASLALLATPATRAADYTDLGGFPPKAAAASISFTPIISCS